MIHYLWGVSNNRRVAPHDALCLPALAELDLSHVDVTIDNTHSFVQFKTKLNAALEDFHDQQNTARPRSVNTK